MKVINSNRFQLPGAPGWIHLATVQHNAREFLCFAFAPRAQVYIEEVSGGSLLFIKDEFLHKEINDFLVEEGLLLMSKPLIPDKDWLYENK